MSNAKVKQVTSVDVAKAAGVSRAAVSRTFSNNGYVSEATKGKVLIAAKALGYRVNHLARSLNRQRSDLVGLVVADMDNPFRSQQVNDLSEAILANNYRPLLIPTAKGRDSSQVIDMLLHYNVSGVIITSDTPPAAIYQNCAEHQVPVVLINKQDEHPFVDRVFCDNIKGIKLILDAFREKQCQHIVVVSSEANSYSIRKREQLFCQYAQQIGLTTEVVYPHTHCYQGGLEAADTLSQLTTQPDGIFCTNDYLALGVIDGIRETQGQDILANLPIAGFDDMLQAKWKSYQLTTIKQATDKMAARSVELLISRIQNPEQQARTYHLDVSLIRRDSL
ncbi:LacI family DNA-binding transcriptional regulator [Photobacterium minamisatsumaniensis]|uniref:LacI family DNA-binding transcriptional regulator n=1 Tax=Photobacterium minamisatsumaniensis TaxID=2910233 RepID=UPI003D115BE1